MRAQREQRAGFLGEAITTHYDVHYLVVCNIVMSMIGAAAAFNVRNHVLAVRDFVYDGIGV